MVRHAAEIGWTPIPPKDALRKRCGETGIFVPRRVGKSTWAVQLLDDGG